MKSQTINSYKTILSEFNRTAEQVSTIWLHEIMDEPCNLKENKLPGSIDSNIPALPNLNQSIEMNDNDTALSSEFTLDGAADDSDDASFFDTSSTSSINLRPALSPSLTAIIAELDNKEEIARLMQELREVKQKLQAEKEKNYQLEKRNAYLTRENTRLTEEKIEISDRVALMQP